jgi:hypothetical protein
MALTVKIIRSVLKRAVLLHHQSFCLTLANFHYFTPFFPTKPGFNVYNNHLNEIARFTDGPELNFKCGNNTERTLVAILAFQTLEKYGEKKLKVDSSILDVIVKVIAHNSKCYSNEASEALLLAFLSKV